VKNKKKKVEDFTSGFIDLR